MDIIFLLVIASLVVAVGFLLLFIWAVKSGQFEDTLTPAMRMLFENKVEDSPNQPAHDDEGSKNTLPQSKTVT